MNASLEIAGRASATLGNPRARAKGFVLLNLPEDYGECVEFCLSLLPPRTIVLFAHECARRVLSEWEQFRPNDDRVEAALAAIGRFTQGTVDNADLEARSDAAATAAFAIDNHGNMQFDEPARFRAYMAAHAASHAALTAALAALPPSSGERQDVPSAGSCAAVLALDATSDPAVERNWQLLLLADFLFKHAQSE